MYNCQSIISVVRIQVLLSYFSLYFSGVVSGFLISLLGLPLVILGSSILLPIGFILSFFITDIRYLYVSIGIVSGNIFTIYINAMLANTVMKTSHDFKRGL